jgi:hypothetical protein
VLVDVVDRPHVLGGQVDPISSFSCLRHVAAGSPSSTSSIRPPRSCHQSGHNQPLVAQPAERGLERGAPAPDPAEDLIARLPFGHGP